MYGEVLAVVAAILWAASMVSAAGTLRNVNPLCANTLKILFGALSMVPIALIICLGQVKYSTSIFVAFSLSLQLR